MSDTLKRDQHFGPYLKELRTLGRITLRQFCAQANADPGNISKLERGVWPPPQDQEILERYAKALSIQEGSDEWYKFFDYAAADRGILPQDLMSDEEVVEALPVLFRTLRREKPSSDSLDDLVRKLRRS
jgi:transcriptional regulator with XRE-family HTH domain